MIDLGAHLDKIDSVERATFDVMRDVIIDITPKVTDFVRSMLERKYLAAGMKSHTGKMLGAIRQTSVRINMWGRKPSIIYSLPSGIDSYNGSDAPFYQVFMGQSYGMVRGATGAKKKDKKAIKKLALKGKDGIAGRYQKTGSQIKYADADGAINFGSVVVTKPKMFWQMTSSEEAQVRSLVADEIDSALKRRR